ncbi:MAG TPA: single-stranded-DNA-specific exonuclease RecJ [Thermoguttaceae bacterium]|nr:single-stranded-DNA-specific exonuclease RecJ [Thermoguttaceae bacterium]
MPKRWRIQPHDPQRIADLARAASISPVVASLLLCRGISDPRVAQQFLAPKLSDLHDPADLPGCTAAAERIHAAIAAGRRIVIYGDYDVDGITGTALLLRCIQMLGGNVGYYVPHRIDEGYGLNHEAIETLADRKTELLVTVDCGIASVEEAATATRRGVELIVTDHHEPGAELPGAAVIVHPRLPGTAYPFGQLSGSGVAFKLAWAVCQQASQAKRVGPRMKTFLLEATGLAALGTVADMVPLVDENRALVTHGLRALAARSTPGLAALARVAKLDDKPELSSEDVAFSIGPRLNAAGRLGQAQLAVELLVTDKPDRAGELADYLEKLNADRQTLERRILLAANKMAKSDFDPVGDAALVLAGNDWNAGVIGIVAGRLVEKHHRPVVLVAWDKFDAKPGIGSARSVPGFNLYEALVACREYLVGFGGHAAAAGLRIERRNLDAFRQAFCEYVAAEITPQQREAELWIDAEAPLGMLSPQSVRQIEQLAPFGQGNPRPLLCTSGVRLAEPPRPIGTGGHHLSLQLVQHDVRLRAVAFGGGDWSDELAALDGPIEIAFRPVINTFRGRQNVEVHLVDWRKCEG